MRWVAGLAPDPDPIRTPLRECREDNILVNKWSNEASLIDFGGGHTHLWIDPELEGTKEGGLQGLGRTLDFVDTKVAGKNLSGL